MSNYLHTLVAEKKKRLGLKDNYYGIQIRTFVDSEPGEWISSTTTATYWIS